MPKITEITSSISSNTRTTTIAAKAPATYAYNSFVCQRLFRNWTERFCKIVHTAELSWTIYFAVYFISDPWYKRAYSPTFMIKKTIERSNFITDLCSSQTCIGLSKNLEDFFAGVSLNQILQISGKRCKLFSVLSKARHRKSYPSEATIFASRTGEAKITASSPDQDQNSAWWPCGQMRPELSPRAWQGQNFDFESQNKRNSKPPYA